MKTEIGKKKTLTTQFGFVILAIFASILLLAGCSDDGGGGGSSVTTVTRYGYRLNYNSSYHWVVKYVAVDNGDNTFEVKSCSVYYFSISNSDYKDRTGAELCDMVRLNTFEPSSSQEYTLTEDKNLTITNSSTGVTDTFHMYKGQSYTMYYYF